MSIEMKKRDNVKQIVLAAVKAIMRAHLEDLKSRGALFVGKIMDVDIDENLCYMKFEFSNEFKEFVEERLRTGNIKDAMNNKIVIILDEDREIKDA